MKTILVAIDFLKGSLHALDYAINMANRFNADVQMIWVDNISSEELVYAHFSSKDKMEIKKNFEKLSKDKESKLTGGKLGLFMRKGKVHIEMAKLAQQLNADLIVAGTHGVTGFESYWIGSNAYRIVTYSPCPVITVRNDFTCCNEIRTILFPVDKSVETKQKLPFTVSLARLFNSTLIVLGLYSTNLKSVQNRIDKHIDSTVKCLTDNNVSYIIEKQKTNNITKSIIDYTDINSIDLVAIMTEQEDTMDHVFLGPHAEQLISHSKTPVLSLKSKAVIDKHNLN